MSREAAPTQHWPVIEGRPAYADITTEVVQPIWQRKPMVWRLLMTGMGLTSGLFMAAILYTVATGIGAWGNNIPVAWAFAIANFVWWIGLAQAGTFISGFLLILEQDWRASINRTAEAMTLFAIAMAGVFPLLHLGRQWFFYWLVPYPATMGVWPQFRSSLPYDAMAVFTYGVVSLLFWYLGMVPDLASARDRAPTRRLARVYSILSLGWRGSARDWHRFRFGYGLLGAFAVPLVVLVHSVVAMDFAIGQIPGWHSTIFPPYFVVGAIYSGVALAIMLLVAVRPLMGWQNIITNRHMSDLAKILLLTGALMGYSYITETFSAWYSGDQYERFIYLVNRPINWPWIYWVGMIFCNAVVPHLFWSRRMRTNPVVLFIASLLIFCGMWIERILLIVTSINRDFLPSSWHAYFPSWVDWMLLLSSIITFVFLFMALLRWVPGAAIHEVKKIRHELEEKGALS